MSAVNAKTAALAATVLAVVVVVALSNCVFARGWFGAAGIVVVVWAVANTCPPPPPPPLRWRCSVALILNGSVCFVSCVCMYGVLCSRLLGAHLF